MKRLLTTLLILALVPALHAQELRFDKNGKFKIAQFTDIHLTPGNPESEVRVPEMIKTVVKAENPDLLVFTGDIVTAKPAMKGWESIAKICAEIGVPYAVTMGNHDPEMTTRDSIYTFLATQPLFVGEKGPEHLTGMGNYVLPVLASDGSSVPAGLVYCMDSNDYSPDQEKYGYYGWIEHNQIGWYREQSDRFTSLNCGKPLPAVAYFHIAIPEARMAVYEQKIQEEVDKALKEGDKRKARFIPYTMRLHNPSNPVNSGLFAAFVEKKDVLGVFAGHVHQLDHVAEYRGVAMGYGRVSGYEAYGKNERGTRIVELHEGEYTFDTWITTPKGKEEVYHFPQFLTSADNSKIEYKPSIDVEPSRNGVSYKYYTGNFQSVNDFAGMKPVEEGFISNFSIEQAKGRDHFGYEFNTYVNIPVDDVYHFSLVCDDGAKLYIDDELVIDRDGSHARDAAIAKVALAKGFHKFRLLYFEDYMGESLGLWVESKTLRRGEFNPEQLFQVDKPGVQLRFNKDGKFRIAQFTDTHLDPNQEKCEKTLDLIKNVIATENPDFVMFTGDIITTGPSDIAWGKLIQVLEEAGKPYGVVTGNHETEVTTRDTIFNYLINSPLFLGKKGIGLQKKMGNYIIPVLASDGSDNTKALFYCLDSGEFGGDQEHLGQYEWFDWEQICWYRNQSTYYTMNNGGQPVPALAFYHIPNPEYRYLNVRKDVYGSVLGVSGMGSAEINSGMFTSFLDMKDVMGIFVGHDHETDLIGQVNGIALGYGRYTGYQAGGKLERGGRIIDLYEGEFKFDSWNVTEKGREEIYYYPANISSSDETSFLPAKKVNPKKQGVKYTYYEGEFKNLSEIETKGTKVASGVMENFIIDQAPVEDHYAYIFNGYINIPETAAYRFYLNSDDGAKLYIDGKLVVDNDGSHDSARKGDLISLAKGFHEIKVEYFEDYMDQELKVRIASRNMPEQLISSDMLYTK